MTFTVVDRDNLLRDPVAFLSNIALTVGGDCKKPELYGLPDQLTLVEDKTVRAYKQIEIGDDVGMQYLPTYMLRKRGPRDAIWFDAYLVEYEDGRTPITVLGQKANLCFTANMNGCTFGIGSQASPTGAVVVTHSNSRNKGSQDANTADQRKKAGAVVGAGGKLFEPEHYRTNGKQSITFGWHKPGKKWKFYFMSYIRASGIVTNYGVQPVTTNQVEL